VKARLDRHGRYRELIAARFDRPLTRAENRLLVGHLKACADCRQTERDYLAQGALLRSMPTPIPPRDMGARTSTALDREVSRRSYHYPRFGRRAIVRDRRSRPGAPGALATMVAAVGVVTVLAILQFGPALRPTPSTAVAVGPATAGRPTPIAIAPQPLAVVAAGERDLTVYQTQVTQVCPTSTPDCMEEEREFLSRTVRLDNLRPQNVALSPNGAQLAFVGHNTDKDVITVVLLRDHTPAPTEPNPTRRPPPSATSAPSEPPPSASPAVEESPQAAPTDTDQPVEPSLEPETTPKPTPDNSGRDATPTIDPPSTPRLEPSPERPSATPPASVVPGGLTVLSILEDVYSAGAPPAWSRDGEVLAFSAMPADGSHGPDVYVWQPGDDQARPITSDHSSYFASWSGRRIVASRLNETTGKSDSLSVLTVVLDPITLEERQVVGPLMWLPVVDPQRSHAVAWTGSLDLTGDLPAVRDGGLHLIDWAALDPFASDDGEPTVPPADVELAPIDPTRDTVANPVLDWEVRWSLDGRVLGIWEAGAPGVTLGTLALLEFDPETGLLSREPLMEEWSRRGFTLGVDRVAWVGVANEGTEGELRIRTWGTDGVGDLRIESLNLEGLVPAF